MRDGISEALGFVTEAGGLSAGGRERFEAGLLELLADHILRYTHGSSYSVRAERAEELMRSILACIGRLLRRFPDRETALRRLAAADPRELFEAGKLLLERDAEEARALLRQVQESRPPVRLLNLEAALYEELPGYLDGFDPVFAAYSPPDCLIYPAAAAPEAAALPDLPAYLRALLLENAYCSRYPAEELEGLLAALARPYRTRAEELGVNLFRETLANALCAALAGTAGRLLLPPERAESLQRTLAALPEEDRRRRILTGFEGLAAGEEEEPRRYIERCAEALAGELARSAGAGLLAERLVWPDDPPSFEEGGRLPDRKFRALADRITACSGGAEKVALLFSGVRCLEDFTDLLSTGCLYGEDYGEDYGAVFARLGEPELGLLLRRAEALDDTLRATAGEEAWITAFRAYLAVQPEERAAAAKAWARGL